MLAYHAKWLPNIKITDESLAQALFLEQESQKNHAIAINNGICMFFENT